MEVKFNKEDRIFMTLVNGTSYEGIVKNFNVSTQRLTLKDIIQHPGNINIEGCRYFEGKEIAKIKLLEPISSDGAVLSNGDNQSICITKAASRKISDAEYHKILELQNSFRYIDNITTNFHTAISILQESDIIGLCVKDTCTGRQERASVIVVSTETNIFIFDLQILGDKVFDKGLRDILQSTSIVKVVYDCRLLSDCLHHKHQTQLTNVRDVEAEDVIVVHQERGCIRKHVRSFGYLVQLYLGIPSEVLDESHLTQSWKVRPLGAENQKFLATFASLLIPLHKAIQEHYLQRMAEASKIYNECVRTADMYVFATENYKYVPRKQLIDLVKQSQTCRGNS